MSEPYRRSRATPPSGKTSRRTRSQGAEEAIRNRCGVSGSSGVRSSSGCHDAGSSHAAVSPVAPSASCCDALAALAPVAPPADSEPAHLRHAGRVADIAGCVDLDQRDHGGRGEADGQPLVPGRAPPSGLPSLAHHPRQAGRDGVARRGVEPVAARDHVGAVLQRRQVERHPLEQRGVGHRDAVHPQPRHPAIGVDPQPHVAVPVPGLGRDLEHMRRVALERRPLRRSPPSARNRARPGPGSRPPSTPPPSTPAGSSR